MRRAPECPGYCLRIADRRVDADVIRAQAHDGGQRLVIDLHALGRVLSPARRFGDDQGERLPDEGGFVAGEGRVGRDERGLELHLVGIGRDRPERDRLQAVALSIGAGKDGKDATMRERLRRVDAPDSCVGVR
jgi:hypothetical protein